MIDFNTAKALVNSTCFWLSHNDAIGRSGMLHEASIRYPFADALTSLEFTSSQILLEEDHPFYVKRSIDLVIVDDSFSKKIKSAFEFKLASKYCTDKPEKTRYFNDLMRLHILARKNKIECYLVVVGEYRYFNAHFRRILTQQQANNTKLKNLPKGFYTKWFGFVVNKEKRFKVTGETDSEYQSAYSDFYGSAKPYRIKDGVPINNDMPKIIKTICLYITPMSSEFHTPWVGGIWKVS